MTEKDHVDQYYFYSNQTQTQPSPSSSNESTTIKTQAVFVNKLYKMLEDSSIQQLITWSEGGDQFKVSNPSAFSKIVLPQYFKHNNWQSFVRQLNMYGFHKVNDMIHSNLTLDSQTWEFKHPHFKKGAIDDLQYIKRKSTKPNFSVSIKSQPISRTLSDQQDEDTIYKHIAQIEDRLHYVLSSCEQLKNESNTLRSLFSQQQKVIKDFALLFKDLIKDEGVHIDPSTKDKISSRISQLLSYHQNVSSLPEPSPLPSSLVDNGSPKNNRHLGFGKESHLLNPEPNDRNKKRKLTSSPTLSYPTLSRTTDLK